MTTLVTRADALEACTEGSPEEAELAGTGRCDRGLRSNTLAAGQGAGRQRLGEGPHPGISWAKHLVSPARGAGCIRVNRPLPSIGHNLRLQVCHRFLTPLDVRRPVGPRGGTKFHSCPYQPIGARFGDVPLV